METTIFTIPFDPETECFDDANFKAFLVNKRIKSMRPEFFQHGAKVYWTCFVQYEPVLEDLRPALSTPGLNEPQRMLFNKLRIWRKEKADKAGIPVFIIATNKELLEVVRKAPQSFEALRQIRGFGKKKLERHGKEIIGLVRAFHQTRPADEH